MKYSSTMIDKPARIGRSTEGLFFNKDITCFTYTKHESYAYKSKTICVRHMLESFCKAYLDPFEGDIYKNVSYGGLLHINKKHISNLKTTVKLFTLKVDGKKNKDVKDIFGSSISGKKEIISTEEDTVENFAKKYGVKYDIIDTSGKENIRKKELISLKKITVDTLKHFKDYKGFSANTIEKEDLEKFYSGESNTIGLIRWDAWVGTENKARDSNALEIFNKKYDDVLKYLEQKAKEENLSGSFSDDGDWDDGTIYYKSKS